MNIKSPSTLQLALFATGLSGIVAEYILATLATYLLGNSVFQWTMILSVMLFSMGLGSRLARYLEGDLLPKFIFIEFILSIFVSFSALLTYSISSNMSYLAILIYGLSIAIGLMIGMEIPLVTRINEQFENLRTNISNVMEKDYYGSLLGGIFFVFVGLPYLGLTYTPFALGLVNFLVAALLLWQTRRDMLFKVRRNLFFMGIGVLFLIATGFVAAEPIVQYGEQARYKDKVVFADQSKYQKIVVTQWKDDYWLYLNGHQQLSSLDEWLYHEPMVHPVMRLSQNPRNVLILGGGDGCAAREVLKYESVETVRLVDLDPLMTELAQNHPIFTKMNGNALNDPKVEVINADAFTYLAEHLDFYDVMILDFPDPKGVELGRLYSRELYEQCYRLLRPNGLLVVQAGSPYYATRAFRCIEATLQASGFATQPLHNQVLTMGEWGWIVGSKGIPQAQLKPRLQALDFEDIPTRWLNQEAMQLITSFGKELIPLDSGAVEVNTIHNPVLSRYYRNGNWELY